MMHLLMLEFDLHLVSAVARTLRPRAVEVVGVQSVEHAHEQAIAQSFDGALLDRDLLGPNDLGALWPLPLILMTAFLDPHRREAWPAARRLLQKPFTCGQLISAVNATVGPLEPTSLSVVDVLRRAHSAGANVALRVGGGEVFVESGEVVHAQLGPTRGEAALCDLLTAIDPIVRRIDERAVERTIRKPFRPLLLDLLRFIEEKEDRPAPTSAARARLRLVRGGERS